MTDEQKEQKEEPQKPMRRPAFGGLGQQYAAVGGTKRSRRQDVQTPGTPDEQKEEPLGTETPSHVDTTLMEQPTIQQSGSPNAQASGSSIIPESSNLASQEARHRSTQEAIMQNTQVPEHTDAQTAGFSDTKKSEKPERKKRTIYLEPDLDRWIRHRIADTDEEISEVINIAVRSLMNQPK